jgi:phosphoribosylaminoimidazole-succinocarboxamide synthase
MQISKSQLKKRRIPGLRDQVISQAPGCDTYKHPERPDLKVLVRNDFLPHSGGDTLFQSPKEGEYVTALLRLFSLEVLAQLEIRSYLAGSIKYPRHNLAKDLRDQYKRLPLARTLVVFEVQPIPFALTFISYLSDEYCEEYAKKGTIAGVAAPAGLVKWQKLPKPLLSIASLKGEKQGAKISADKFLQKCQGCGAEIIEMLEEVFAKGSKFAEANGLVLLQSRFKVGRMGTKIMVCNDFLTANSSRYIFADNLAKITTESDDTEGGEPVYINNKGLFEELAGLTLKEFQTVYLL